MVHHFLNRRTPKPDFPTAQDVPCLTLREAQAALGLLRLLVSAGQADVYTRPWREPGQRWNWNVLSNTDRRRYDLEEWATRMLCLPYTPDDAA